MLTKKKTSPFFLLGVQRSGTTLLRLLLDAHSRIAIPFESMVLIEYYYRTPEYNYLENANDRKRLVTDLLSARGIKEWNPKINTEDINIEKCTDYAMTIDQIFSSYAEKCGKTIWGDKTPSYTKDFHILNELFPLARFINLIRDGRDVALSLVRQPWGPGTFSDALEYWAEIVTWSRKMGRLLPKDRYLELRFEDLVSRPEEMIKNVLAFLCLDFEPEIFQRNPSRIKGKLPHTSVKFHTNLKRPIDSSLAYKWRDILGRVDQAISWQIAGKLFEDLGYPSGRTEAPKLFIVSKKIQYWAVEAISWRIKKMRLLVK